MLAQKFRLGSFASNKMCCNGVLASEQMRQDWELSLRNNNHIDTVLAICLNRACRPQRRSSSTSSTLHHHWPASRGWSSCGSRPWSRRPIQICRHILNPSGSDCGRGCGCPPTGHELAHFLQVGKCCSASNVRGQSQYNLDGHSLLNMRMASWSSSVLNMAKVAPSYSQSFLES